MTARHRLGRGLSVAILALAGPAAVDPAAAGGPLGRYQVTIENTNPGQNFSPPVLVLHRPGFQLFELGRLASEALWQLAEDGSTAAFEALDDPALHAVVVAPAVHRRNAPVVTTELAAPEGLALSIVAMLSLTNDGFVAAQALALPDAVGGSVMAELRAYDAGSEANTESCAHVPCEVHGRRMTAGAEGAVSEHPGLRGDADLPPARRWHEPVLGTLTITRLR
jgi:Spondin_N